MLDELIVTEVPPLYGCYGRIGAQVRVPITGGHARRILHGTINVGSGDILLFITADWDQETHQTYLSLLRAHWRGWNIVLFEDRAGQHTAPDSRAEAAALDIEVRRLPKATPELNAMDHRWRHTKREILSNRPPEPIDQSAQQACDYLFAMSPRERLQRAGVLSGNFWLLA
jgi:hypothetical protein